MFTQGLLNIMLLSNLKDRIVRGHPGILRISVLSASRTSVKNAIKGAAAQSIFSMFHFFPFFFPFSICVQHLQRLAKHSVGNCERMCVHAWWKGNGITATQLIRSISPTSAPVFLSLSHSLRKSRDRPLSAGSETINSLSR